MIDLILSHKGKHRSHRLENCFAPQRKRKKKLENITKLHIDEDLKMK